MPAWSIENGCGNSGSDPSCQGSDREVKLNWNFVLLLLRAAGTLSKKRKHSSSRTDAAWKLAL